MINFSTRILDCDSHSDASIFSTVAFPPLGNSDLVVISVSIDCPSNPKGMPLFIAQLMAFISIVFSCLSCCHSSQIILLLFVPTINLHLKLSSDKLVIVAKRFLKLPNLFMLIKQKSLLLPRNVVVATFGTLSIVFPSKVNLLYLIYLMALRRCLLLLIKQCCLLKTSKNSNLDDSGIFLPVFPFYG